MPDANPILIDDIDDPRLDDYRNLRDRDLHRASEGLFVGEQALIVERMLTLPGVVRSVLVGETMVDRLCPLVPEGVPLFVAPMELLERIAGFPVHRGVLAVGIRSAIPSPTLDALAGAGRVTLLLVEDITHADNVGQLFRVAAALAVDGVLLSPRCHDPLYRRCVRVSIGHALTVPWRVSDDWLGDLSRLRDEFGVTLIGAATGPEALALDEVEPPPRVGLLVGTEFAGLSPTALRMANALLRIPMADGVDSLNVAVAAGICLHRLSPRNRR